MSPLSDRMYIRWDAPGVEEIPPNEKADILAAADRVNESQRQFYEKNGYCYTGTHARTQGIVRGTFTVPDDLPAHLKQSELFQKGGEYPVVCRYSSEPSDPKLDDRKPQPRGFAMKIFGVEGDMFDSDSETHTPTQDIEFNSTPALDLADAKTTKEIFALRVKHGYDTEEMDRQMRARDDTELQKTRFQVLNKHLEYITFYSQTAYRFGEYVMKFSLAPVSEAQKRRADEEVDAKTQEDGILCEWLREYFRENEAVYEFRVQLLENLEEQPVEYGGAEWDENKYPWQTVGRLILPRQESWNEERVQFWRGKMVLNPWHGLVKLQPLGSANRLRRVVYPASSTYRRKLNGEEPAFFKSVAEVPGY